MSAAFSDDQKGSLSYALDGVKHAFMSPMTDAWRIEKSESPHGAVVDIGLTRHIPGAKHTYLFVGSLGGWLMDIWKEQGLHRAYRTAHLCFDAPRPSQGADPFMDDSLCRLFDKNQLNAIFPKGPTGRVWLITGAMRPHDVVYLCRMMRRILKLRDSRAVPQHDLKFCHIQIVPQNFDSRFLPGDLSKRWTIKDQGNGNWPQYGPRYHPAMWKYDLAFLWTDWKRFNPAFDQKRRSLVSFVLHATSNLYAIEELMSLPHPSATHDSVPSSQAGTPQAGQKTQGQSIRPETRASMQAAILDKARSISKQPSLPQSTSFSRPDAGGQPGRPAYAGNGGRPASSGQRQRIGSFGRSSVSQRQLSAMRFPTPQPCREQ